MAWLLLHGFGLGLGFALDYWVWYWAAFAFVEVVGLASDWPFTWTVRSALSRRRGPQGFLWDVAVAGWCAVFVATWMLYAPLPVFVKGPIGIAFTCWISYHLFYRPEYKAQ